ncbi:hypothetical protein D9M71_356130 [compost metagenome]
MAVGEVGQGHTDKGEHTPTMQAPVKEQQFHRLAPGLYCPRFALGRLEHVGQGFGYAEEK